MQNKGKEQTSFNYIEIALGCLFVLGFCFWGLFKEHAAVFFSGLYGSLLFMGLVTKTIKKEKVLGCLDLKQAESYGTFWISCLLPLCYFISSLWAIDSGMALIGFWRLVSLPFFVLLISNIEQNKKEMFLNLIPYSGIGMVLIGFASRLIPAGYSYFYVADRLGGFFQYPNVFAIYLLSGIHLTFEKSKWSYKEYILAFGLLLGILLSGSRSVFVLAVVYLLLVLAVGKEKRRIALLLLMCMVIGAAGYAILTKNLQNVGRILTTSIHSSTLVGRLLYARDAMELIKTHPFGMGYLGYYYTVPGMQHGVYAVRFVHNDLLQLALDIGILPVLFLLGSYVFAVCRMFSKNPLRSIFLFILLGHFLFDFDLEFVSVYYLIFALFELGRVESDDMSRGSDLDGNKQSNKVVFVISQVVIGLFSALCLYIGVGMAFRYVGQQAMSVSLLPHYTEAKMELMLQEKSEEKQLQLAQSILKQNQYIPYVFDILAKDAYEKEDYKTLCDMISAEVSLGRYQSAIYDRAITLLSMGVSSAGQNGEYEMVEQMLDTIVWVDQQMTKVIVETDPLAYEIKDKPNLEYSDEVKSYVEQVKALQGL